MAAEVEMAMVDEARYIGVDLAWGQRARTGLAVLDDAGRLLESASVRTDDEIVAFVDRYATQTLVAAVDAPLVVPNETGRRLCEALVGQLFARFGAGAYPANRANPIFMPQPRGARLAAQMSWDMDPSTRPGAGQRVCIEVYPHPAMVSLFPLDYVIPYKLKRGRELPPLKDAYRRLLDHLEVTCGEVLDLADSARWRALRSTAAGASRKSELDAIEDEIDAIFCAYLAWLWATDQEKMVVLGDYATGYIVTPTPPPSTTLHGRPVRRKPARE
jgi:predicted RNase H-like nuclease